MPALALTLLLAVACAAQPRPILVERWTHLETHSHPAWSLLTLLDLYADGSRRYTLVSPDRPGYVEQDPLTYEARGGVFTQRVTGNIVNGRNVANYDAEQPAVESRPYRLDGDTLTMTLRGKPFVLHRLRPRGRTRAASDAARHCRRSSGVRGPRG